MTDTLEEAPASHLPPPTVIDQAPIDLPAIAVVTPDVAREYLDHNIENRILRDKWVDALAREIREGRWMMTGDSIRFDTQGHLIDGQHRLNAIIRANVAVPLFVIRNLPTEVRNVIDTGMVRSARDVLHFNDIDIRGIAPTARIAMLRRDGYLTHAVDQRAQKYTSAAILEFVQENPTLEGVVPAAYSSGSVVHVTSRPAWAYAMWVLKGVNPDAQIEFENSLVESRTNGQGDARLALIRHFARSAPREKNPRFYGSETLYVTFAAWNAWRLDREVVRFQSVTGGTGPQGAAIPTPVV